MPPAKKFQKPAKRIARERDEKALDHKSRFLISFRKWGLKSRALDEADLTLPTLKRWLEGDAAFAAKFDEVSEEVAVTKQEDLEEAAMRRALVKSDNLIKFLLQAMDPKYKERGELEHRGSVIVVFRENIDLEGL